MIIIYNEHHFAVMMPNGEQFPSEHFLRFLNHDFFRYLSVCVIEAYKCVSLRHGYIAYICIIFRSILHCAHQQAKMGGGDHILLFA
jgi:hypothetical protein